MVQAGSPGVIGVGCNDVLYVSVLNYDAFQWSTGQLDSVSCAYACP